MLLTFIFSLLYVYSLIRHRNLAKVKTRSFIKLDQNGVCVACLQCVKPLNESWLEVDNYCISWLGKKPKI